MVRPDEVQQLEPLRDLHNSKLSGEDEKYKLKLEHYQGESFLTPLTTRTYIIHYS